MSLLEKTQKNKTFILSFRVSVKDIEKLDSDKSIVVNIKGDDYTLKRKKQ